MTLDRNRLRAVLQKLDDVRMEILRLRAQLLSIDKLTARERREIELARREISRGRYVSLGKLLRELDE